jgi:hypothetical protein
MKNRSKNRWLDIQILLASLAMTFTLGLWNMFARGSRLVASTVIPPTPDPASIFTFTPDPTATAPMDPSAPVRIPRVHILLGGKMPVAPVVVAASSADASNPQKNPPQDGGNNPVPTPTPVANTGSSKP